jgi:hypothetical protein
VLDHENKVMEKIVIGVAINEAEISDKEVSNVMASTTLVKTSPLLGVYRERKEEEGMGRKRRGIKGEREREREKREQGGVG